MHTYQSTQTHTILTCTEPHYCQSLLKRHSKSCCLWFISHGFCIFLLAYLTCYLLSHTEYISLDSLDKKKKKIQSLKSLELINSSRRAIANVYMLLSIGQAESWCNGIERDQKVPSSSIRRHLPHSTPCQATNQTHLSKLSCVELLAAAFQQYLSKKSCEGFCLTFFFIN